MRLGFIFYNLEYKADLSADEKSLSAPIFNWNYSLSRRSKRNKAVVDIIMVIQRGAGVPVQREDRL